MIVRAYVLVLNQYVITIHTDIVHYHHEALCAMDAG